ncbi:MAG TPA: secretin N-terminal domain-containing protein, partial [bacterium]|nr:secretin N-terminal domain-containing protein [bacterium]
MRRVFFSFLIVALAASGIILPSGLNGADDTISLNFEDVALGTVLTIMSRKTGRKFITDNQLAQKKIFIDISNVTADEALTALLNMYNLYYVRQGETNIYVIKSKTEGELTTVSKIFYCNYATAQELSGVIAPKLSKGGNISADVRTNSLIVTDMADNIDQIGTLITVLDTPTPQVLLEARIVD